MNKEIYNKGAQPVPKSYIAVIFVKRKQPVCSAVRSLDLSLRSPTC